jgi:peptide-methionine (R)-S-oxide reductase
MHMQRQAVKSKPEWSRKLTPEQYRITQQKGTEPAYSGRYHDFNENGIYRCICCGNDLFSSGAKFIAKAKWPAFWAPAGTGSVKTAREIFHFMIRNEVRCTHCDAHLGYVFEDGRPPTGVRYFINSAALLFVATREAQGTQSNDRIQSGRLPEVYSTSLLRQDVNP